MHPLPSKLVFSTGQNHPEGVQDRKISPDGDHASALIFGGPRTLDQMSFSGSRLTIISGVLEDACFYS